MTGDLCARERADGTWTCLLGTAVCGEFATLDSALAHLSELAGSFRKSVLFIEPLDGTVRTKFPDLPTNAR